MCAQRTGEKPNFLLSIISNRCPRCRRGKLFQSPNPYHLKGFMKMNQSCPTCSQPFEMEPGFYYGTGFVSYALAIAVSVATLVIWWALIGISTSDNRFFWWIGVNAVILVLLQPPLMRLSRSIWLSFFVHYSPDWDKSDIVEPERINRDQANNW